MNLERKYDIYRTISYDTQLITGQTEVSFFNHEVDEGVTAGQIIERDLVRWFFNQSGGKDLLFDEIGRYSKYFLDVKQPIIVDNRRPGDVDVLLLNSENIKESVAIECKRIKVTLNSEGKETINKLHEIEKGVIQANGLRELGFHKSYLMLCIVSDARFDKTNNHLFRKPSADKLSEILLYGGLGQLHENVGLISCILSQPTGKSIMEHGTIYLLEKKKAKPQDQSFQLTERIINFIKR